MLVLLTSALFAVSIIATLEPTEARAKKSYDGDVKACNGKDVHLKPTEKKTLQLHNRARVSRDKPRLCIQQQLQRAARKHSADMTRNDYFSHDSQDGTSFAQRVKREGYTAKDMSVYRIGENLGGGSGSYRSPDRIHKAWMNSDGHRKNMLKKGYRQVGIGVANGEYKSYENYRMYTVDLGFRRR